MEPTLDYTGNPISLTALVYELHEQFIFNNYMYHCLSILDSTILKCPFLSGYQEKFYFNPGDTGFKVSTSSSSFDRDGPRIRVRAILKWFVLFQITSGGNFEVSMAIILKLRVAKLTFIVFIRVAIGESY